MILGVLTGAAALACLCVAFLSARERGPVFMLSYLSATEKEREEMKTRDNYRIVTLVSACLGVACLVVSIVIFSSR